MATRPSVSFEFFPPTAGEAEPRFHRTVERLAPLDPDFISVTYGAGGSARGRGDRIIRDLLARGDVDVAAHLTCIGTPRSEIDALAKSWAEAGLHRIVALRGDPPDPDQAYRPHPQGYRDAAALVAGLRALADFDISVAAYPESHPAAPSPACDLDALKRKFDAGADRALTQFFFDPETFLRFRDQAARAGITAPIVPGILPITDFNTALKFSRRCGVTVPAWLAARFAGLDRDPETRAMIAATTASELCQGLLAEGVTAFHFYTLNQAALTTAICRMLGIQPGLKEAA